MILDENNENQSYAYFVEFEEILLSHQLSPGTVPEDSLNSDGFRPEPNDEGSVTLTANLRKESPIFNVEVTLKNAEPDTSAIITVLDENENDVETREVDFE